MPYGFLDIASTPGVRAAQEANGSGEYWANFHGDRAFDRFSPAEAAFIAERDSLYMATVSENGWPYVQHRGGPPGFIRILDEKTLAIPDFRGNRQYISTGNLATDDRAALILMDYPHRRRLKIYAHIEARDLSGRSGACRRSSRCPAPRRRSSVVLSSISPPSTGTVRSTSFRVSAKPSSSRRSRRFVRGSKRWRRKIRLCVTSWRRSVSRSEAPEPRRRTPEAKERRSRSG